jgi:YcxB-like protein
MAEPRVAAGTATARDPPFDLAFRVDPRDYRALLRAARWSGIEHLAALLPVLAIVSGAALIGLVIFLSSGTSEAAAAAGGMAVACAAILYVFYRFALLPLYDRSVFTGQPMALGLIKLVVDNRGVASNMADIVLAMPWSSVARVVETDQHVFLIFARLAAVIVPKRAFESPDQAKRFAAFARSMAPGRQ